jgi:hypothetical protein
VEEAAAGGIRGDATAAPLFEALAAAAAAAAAAAGRKQWSIP